MTVTVFDSGNWHLYEDLFRRRLAGLDIYYHPSYLVCEAANMQGECLVFLLQDKEEKYFVYPFIKKGIPIEGFEDYSDIISPYGYCGPVSNCEDPSFFASAEKELCNYLVQQKVVNEFVRYHYLYNNKNLFTQNIANAVNRNIVTVDTSGTWEDIWMGQYSATNRNLIRKMEKEGYSFRFADDVATYKAFIHMYYQTMDNAGAHTSYYFPESWFLALREALPDNLKLGVVEKDGVVYSAALFFITAEIATYYLSARNLSFPKLPSVNFLLSKTMESLQGSSVKLFNLGGGTDSDPENSLLKFKLNFSRHTREFRIGKRVHLPEVYGQMKKAYSEMKGLDTITDTPILQFYR